MEHDDIPDLITEVSEKDHIFGPENAPITIVEYGDYQCPHCFLAHGIIEEVLHKLEDEVKFVFRHFPLKKIHKQSQLAAEAAEAAGAQGKYWEMHQRLFKNQTNLSMDNLIEIAKELDLNIEKFSEELQSHVYARKISENILDGVKSGVNGTPTFFINGKRYNGAFDVESIIDQIQKPLGVKIRLLTQEFSRLEAAGGIFLFIFTILALIVANFPIQELSNAYFDFWHLYVKISIGSFEIKASIVHWINDGLMAIFFFVVGLEIKREVTVGELASFKKSVLPITGAIGGMIVPAMLYVVFNFNISENLRGWAIPMATDIAFSIVILTVLGKKIPLSIKVFFTALAIADDLGAIIVIGLFYTSNIDMMALTISGIIFLALLFLNRTRIYWTLPYAVLGIMLWLGFFYSGLHPTIAGVLLAISIPTRSPTNTPALLSQCNILLEEIQISPEKAEQRRQSMAKTLEHISERMLSPAQRLERDFHPWSIFIILPIFAFANAGVIINLSSIGLLLHPINLGIIFGLVVGKPLGISLFVFIATKLGVGELPHGVSWFQFISATFVAGIGFTMSIFISSAAFQDINPELANIAKVGILFASLLASIIGLVLLSKSNKVLDKHSTIELPVVSGNE
jgi:NhaA family Na+:H+ antiporter